MALLRKVKVLSTGALQLVATIAVRPRWLIVPIPVNMVDIGQFGSLVNVF
jgi:hypothetical protein